MAKIKLLNDGHYDHMGKIQFPVIVDGTEWRNASGNICGYDVKHTELSRIGAPNACGEDESLFWLLGNECELVEAPQ